VENFPKCGGANGSIRFAPEINHGANAGLAGGVSLLQPIKDDCPEVSWADLMQMGSALAVELMGGPKIPMRYGRVDVSAPEECAKEGNLPGARAPFHTAEASAAEHLRFIFHRMGLTDQDIVALSGAHSVGRVHASRSGAQDPGKESTKYTANEDGSMGTTKGGQSWTAKWLTFSNDYFVDVKAKADADLLVLPTDAALFEDEGFKPFAEKYAASQDAFFTDYAAAHAKLSELGAKFDGEVAL